MVTLVDVAKASGVSPMTVSNALRGKPNVSASTRARVLQVAEDLGYRVNHVAKSLRSGRAGTIGLTVPEIALPFSAQLAEQVTRIAAEYELRVLILETHSDLNVQASMIAVASSGLVDGVILTGVTMTEAQIESLAITKPVVLFDEGSSSTTLDLLASPNVDGSAAAARHLVEKGRSRIAVLGSNPLLAEERRPHAASTLRLAGIEKGLAPFGLTVPPERTIHSLWNAEASRDALRQAIQRGVSFDAVFCMTDTLALGALRALADESISCPGDVLVMGFDGIPEGAIAIPSLSTIDIHIDELARSAVELLVERIEDSGGELPPRRIVGGFTLMERESTQAANP